MPDLAAGKPASASSIESATYAAGKGNDGSSTTRWSSAERDGEWWQVDLGAAQSVASVTINWEVAYSSHYLIQASLDGRSFTTAADVTTTGPGLKTTAFAPTNARYIRILGLTRGTKWGSSFWEVNIYGPAATANPTKPVLENMPTISGTAAVGETLTSLVGTWSGTQPITYTRKWQRCTSSCTAIGSADSATYLVDSADVGATIRVAVTATNAAGSTTATSSQTTTVKSAQQSQLVVLGTSLPARMPESTGPNFYVDGSAGSDSSSGTVSAPWRTINEALAAVPLSGSIINVRGGEYVGQVLWRRSGDPSNPVTLQPYPGEHVLLTAPPSSLSNAVYVDGGGGIRIRGFEVTAPTSNNGFRIENAHDVEVAGSDIHNAGHMGLLVVGTGNSGNRNIQVWNNRFHDNGGAWISQDSYWLRGDHGVYWGAVSSNTDGIDHSAYGGVIANNLFYNQPYGRALQIGSQVSGLIVTNNTFYRAYQEDERAGNAIQFYGEDNRFAPRNVLAVNNIIADNAHHGVYGSGGNDVMATNVVRNNLARNNPSGDFVNTYGSPDRVLYQLGTNFTGQDPLFVNAAGGDLHLRSGSPALGKGDPAYAPPTDLSGRARSGAPDLGAFEQ